MVFAGTAKLAAVPELTSLMKLQFSVDAFVRYILNVEGRSFPTGSPLAVPVMGAPYVAVPPLAAVPTFASKLRFDRDLSARSVSRAFVAASAMQARSVSSSVEATGTLDTVRYGSILKPRSLIGVTGAGYSFDGYYVVSKVRHQIGKGAYSQSFTLSREGIGSVTPVVM